MPGLNAAAIEVNQCWNYANEISFKAAHPFAGPRRWLSAFDLDRLTAGATEYFERIGSGEHAARCVRIVNERNTTRTCSNCGSFTGPTGLDKLFVRQWKCRECGVTHDRDVNAARNILVAGRCCPSVSGTESSPSAAPPSQTSS